MRRLFEKAAWPIWFLEITSAGSAVWILISCHYHVVNYLVGSMGPHFEPMACIALTGPALIVVLAVAHLRLSWKSGCGWTRAAARLASRCAPLLGTSLIVIRALAGLGPLFVEPLLLAASLGLAAALLLADLVPRAGGGRLRDMLAGKGPGVQSREMTERYCFLAVLVLSLLATAYFYFLQIHFLDHMLYGFSDAGQFYMRLHNTVRGVGFLRQDAALGPFWDHFNPGLALLLPFELLERSFHVVLVAQALSLGLFGVAVWYYVARVHRRPVQGIVWASAALAYPALSQLSYSFSYGFHPVSLALVPATLSVVFWHGRRWLPFALSALVAVSFEETVAPFYVAMGLSEAVFSRTGRRPAMLLAAVSITYFLVVTELVMPAFSPEGRFFQLTKYAALGDSTLDIALSPIRRPRVVASFLFGRASWLWIAMQLVPLLCLSLLAPRRLCYACILVLFVCLLGNPHLKSIAIQYQTIPLAALLPAAADGARRLSARLRRRGTVRRPFSWALAAGVLLSCFSAGHFYGLLPWSRSAFPFQAHRASLDQRRVVCDRVKDFARAVPPDASVLVTHRTGLFFAHARELVFVADCPEDPRPDYACLSVREPWGQDPERTSELLGKLRASGDYEIEQIATVFLLSRNLSPPIR
jgi:uncharacterized membrane protein